MAPEDFIGKVYSFSCEPYDFGTGKLVTLEQYDPGYFGSSLMWACELEVVEGWTVSRLFQHTSKKLIKPGTLISLSGFMPSAFEKEHLRYVYGV